MDATPDRADAGPGLVLLDPKVYIDTSAYTIRRYPAELVASLRSNGQRKALFGTSYPMITAERALAELGTLELTTELFLGGNTRRVFGLGGLS